MSNHLKNSDRLLYFNFVDYIIFQKGLYYGVSICLVSFASGLSVVTLNLHHRGLRGTEVPYILRRIILGGLARLVLLRFDVDERHSSSPASTPSTSRENQSSGSSGDPSIPASRLASARNFNGSPTQKCTAAETDLRCTCGKSSHGGRVHQRSGRSHHHHPGVSATTSSSGWYPTPINGGPPGGRNSQERLRLRLQVTFCIYYLYYLDFILRNRWE